MRVRKRKLSVIVFFKERGMLWYETDVVVSLCAVTKLYFDCLRFVLCYGAEADPAVNDWNVFLLPLVYLSDCILQQSGEFLLHIPCWLHFYMRTHHMLASFLSREFVLHIRCWLHFYLGSFSHTSRAGFIFIRVVSLTNPTLALFSVGSFSYTSRAGSIFFWGVSLTHPVLASFLFGEFLLHIPCWLHFYLGSFSYTSRAGFSFIWGVSLTHPMLTLFFMSEVYLTHAVLALFLSGESLLHVPCWLRLLSGDFLLHIPCWFLFLAGKFLLHIQCMLALFLYGELPSTGCVTFSYTSLAGFIFIWGVSLTHPVLASFLSGEFFLHIPYWIYFSVGCFSYTSHVRSFF